MTPTAPLPAPAPTASNAPTVPTWRAVLATLMAGQALSDTDTAWAMNEIMAGEAAPAQLAAFAVLLRAKGETPQEVAGLVDTMLRRAPAVSVQGRCVDVVGTGGDGAHTVNLSTMAAIVVAGSGRTVVKHGNRAASSRCGTADVLEALGVAIDLPAGAVSDCAQRAGISFCFAPVFHSGLRHAAGVRRDLGVATVFNILGPLTNPARPGSAAIGCADVRLAPIMAAVLAARGDAALVFRGDDGLDELTTATTSQLWAVGAGEVHHSVLDPASLGLLAPAAGALLGGDAQTNAAVVRSVLAGGQGPVRDAVLLNAAAGIAAFDRDLDDVTAALSRGIDAAQESIDTGAAAASLEQWVRVSQQLRAGLS